MDKPGNGSRRWYAFEKLEVYHLAVRFRALVKRIVATLPAHLEDDAKQITRSAKSSVRNICEGSGEFRPVEKARFYRMALRSSQESGGTLRIIEDETRPSALIDEAHAVNHELIAKLTVLVKNKSQRK